MASVNERHTVSAEAMAALGVHDHACLMYESPADQLAVAAAVIGAGLARGEQCLYVAGADRASAVAEALRAAGIDLAEAAGAGALRLTTWRETGIGPDCAAPDRMAQRVGEAARSAAAGGHSALRLISEMPFAPGGEIDADRLLEYETTLTGVLAESPCLAVCQYSLPQVRPEVLLDVLRLHPVVICGGSVCRNFYYEPPGPGEAGRERLARLLRALREHHQSAEALAGRARSTRALLDAPDESILLLDRHGVILEINQTAARRLGRTPAALVGESAFDLLPPGLAAA